MFLPATMASGKRAFTHPVTYQLCRGRTRAHCTSFIPTPKGYNSLKTLDYHLIAIEITKEIFTRFYKSQAYSLKIINSELNNKIIYISIKALPPICYMTFLLFCLFF
jgi:hypothetical protein